MREDEVKYRGSYPEISELASWLGVRTCLIGQLMKAFIFERYISKSTAVQPELPLTLCDQI
jgi:hypothetical protein